MFTTAGPTSFAILVKVVDKLTGFGDLQRLCVGAVNLRLFSIYPMGHDRPDQNTGRQSRENCESEA